MSRRKREYRTDSRENYDRFLSENKLTEKELPFQKWKKNLHVCNWMFMEYALRTGLQVPLPFGWGSIAVNKKKLKTYKEYDGKQYINLRVDWAKTRKVGKRIFHTNEHSDGFNFKWYWSYKDASIHLAELYKFKPARYASRAIAKYVKKAPHYKEQYLEWTKPYYK